MRASIAVLICLCCAAPVAPAAAQVFAEPGDAPADPWAYEAPRVRVTTDFSFFSGSQTLVGMPTDYFGMGFVFSAQVRVVDHLFIDAAWGFPHGAFNLRGTDSPIGGGGTRVGNPYLGATYVVVGSAVRMHFSLGVALPLSAAPDWDPTDPMDLDDFAMTQAPGLVARVEGNVRPWLYLTRALSIVGKARIESEGPFLLAADLAVAPMIAVDDTGVYDGDTELVLVPAAEIGWRAYPFLRLGLRGQVAILPTQTEETLGSLEPFIEAEKIDVGYFRLAFVVQLGGPNGSTFDDDGLWGLRLTAGVEF